MTHACRSDWDELICVIKWSLWKRREAEKIGFFLCSLFFFLLTQFVAKLNVLVRKMTHQPEVQKGDGANFSFTSLSIAHQFLQEIMHEACDAGRCALSTSPQLFLLSITIKCGVLVAGLISEMQIGIVANWPASLHAFQDHMLDPRLWAVHFFNEVWVVHSLVFSVELYFFFPLHWCFNYL